MEQQLKSITLLSGPIGAGKTTIAPELVKLMPGPVAYIEGDKFWGFIANGADTTDWVENFKMIMRSMALAALPYARTGYDVIIDFSIPPWYLPAFVKIIGERNIVLNYVIIRPDLEICKERAANRACWAIADYTPYERLYDSFGEAQKHIIYNNTGDAATIAGYIWEGINKELFLVPENNA